MFNGIIYRVTCLVNGKVYIGKTTHGLDKRRKRHEGNSLNNKLNNYFYKAIRKHGWDNFKWEIIDTANNEQELNLLEKLYIEDFRLKGKVYNLTDGGEGMVGYKSTIEHKRKMSEAAKGNKNSLGYKHTEEFKKKISEALKGHKHTIATREKMSESKKGNIIWLGRHHSDETRLKMSESLKGKHTGPLTEEHKRKISEALKGKQNSLGRKCTEEHKKKLSESGKAAWAKRKLAEACYV